VLFRRQKLFQSEKRDARRAVTIGFSVLESGKIKIIEIIEATMAKFCLKWRLSNGKVTQMQCPLLTTLFNLF
jgi:hypothetical protein